MNDKKIVEFIQKLSKETLANRIAWKSVCYYQNTSFDADNSLSLLFRKTNFIILTSCLPTMPL